MASVKQEPTEALALSPGRRNPLPSRVSAGRKAEVGEDVNVYDINIDPVKFYMDLSRIRSDDINHRERFFVLENFFIAQVVTQHWLHDPNHVETSRASCGATNNCHAVASV